jgi:hypothetical protein
MGNSGQSETPDFIWGLVPAGHRFRESNPGGSDQDTGTERRVDRGWTKSGHCLYYLLTILYDVRAHTIELSHVAMNSGEAPEAQH